MTAERRQRHVCPLGDIIEIGVARDRGQEDAKAAAPAKGKTAKKTSGKAPAKKPAAKKAKKETA